MKNREEFAPEIPDHVTPIYINGIETRGLKDSGCVNSYILAALLNALFQSTNWCTWTLPGNRTLMCVLGFGGYQGIHKVHIAIECADDAFVLGRDVLEAASKTNA